MEKVSPTLLEKEFIRFPEGVIYVIHVMPSIDEASLLKNEKGDKEETLYVRHKRLSEKLNGIELAKFIRKKTRDGITVKL